MRNKEPSCGCTFTSIYPFVTMTNFSISAPCLWKLNRGESSCMAIVAPASYQRRRRESTSIVFHSLTRGAPLQSRACLSQCVSHLVMTTRRQRRRDGGSEGMNPCTIWSPMEIFDFHAANKGKFQVPVPIGNARRGSRVSTCYINCPALLRPGETETLGSCLTASPNHRYIQNYFKRLLHHGYSWSRIYYLTRSFRPNPPRSIYLHPTHHIQTAQHNNHQSNNPANVLAVTTAVDSSRCPLSGTRFASRTRTCDQAARLQLATPMARNQSTLPSQPNTS